MNSQKSDRRGFLKRSAALAGLAMGAIPFANGKARAAVDQRTIKEGVTPDEPNIQDLLYGGRSRYETSVFRTPSPGRGLAQVGLRNLTPLQDSMGVITPASLHYIVARDLTLPNIDPSTHTLMIHGMVDRPVVYTMDEIKRLRSVSRVHFLECTGNSGLYHYREWVEDIKAGRTDIYAIQGVHGRLSCSEWTGVPLSLLLKEAGVQKQAKWVIAEGNDIGRHAKSMPLAKAMDDIIVAYGQNGEALRREQGYPLRLVVPGFQGVNNVKYIRSIKLVDEPYYLRAEVSAYTNLHPNGKASWYESQVGPKSVITFPSDPHKLPGAGYYQISGVAWCGRGKIARVEVSTDGGRSWKDASLQQPIFSKAWTRFLLNWNWDGKQTEIMSRATNEYGDIQPTVMELAQLWGKQTNPPESAAQIASFWETAAISQFLNNPIQIWKISPDGSVHDGTFSNFRMLPGLVR
jgi:sulfane dehydrogenase subunit SoxC